MFNFAKIQSALKKKEKMKIGSKIDPKSLLNFLNKNFYSTQSPCISISCNKANDTIFVRHAHSEFNKACQDYRLKHKIDYDWYALRAHKGFDQAVTYNREYIDCPLTEKGYEQCYLTSHNLDFSQIDLILVSPHNRALQTCQTILKHAGGLFKCQLNKRVPVIVEPLIAGSLWSSCDISERLDKKMGNYPQFDFSKVSSLPDLWYTSNLNQSDKLKISQQIKRRNLTDYQDKQQLVLQLLRNSEISQSSQILRQRAFMIKNLLKKLKQKHCNFLLISHYYVIQYMNTRAFRELDHKPVDDVDLRNCCPYYNNLETILNYK